MNFPNVGRFVLAAGATSAVLYVGCALTMRVLPEKTLIRFFNALLHGLDVSSIVRHDVPLSEAVIGAVAWFIIGGVLGGVFAGVYNLRAPRES
jgi:hypothetical protein